CKCHTRSSCYPYHKCIRVCIHSKCCSDGNRRKQYRCCRITNKLPENNCQGIYPHQHTIRTEISKHTDNPFCENRHPACFLKRCRHRKHCRYKHNTFEIHFTVCIIHIAQTSCNYHKNGPY